MGENWVTLLEHHVTFAEAPRNIRGLVGMLATAARYWQERDSNSCPGVS
jgi:hypothetical protein